MNRSTLCLVLTGAALVIGGCTAVPVGPTSVAPAPIAAGPSQLLEDVRMLSTDDMQGRDTGSPGGERARAYIVARLEAIGVQAPPFGRLQPFEASGRTREGVKTFSGVNIVGLIPGRRAADRYIVVTAHYDHVGVNDGQIFHGADDNASGVATLLELAARLKAQPPEHSVLIVALDGEERGLLGAREFVKAPPVPLSSISLNLNFDMTARAETDGHLWVTGTYQHPNLRPILEGVQPNGVVSFVFGKDTPQDTGENNWVEASDHAAFHAAGVPFLYMGVDYHPDYHRPSDTFERITPSVFTSATEIAIAGFRALDQALDQ
ncbi:M28 family peptidase [Brevundimonas sp.]|uniref:M28 family peptidase n=1 Tax=Brevundimonas sp. TaxID=1871086 RepID=UPI0035679031